MTDDAMAGDELAASNAPFDARSDRNSDTMAPPAEETYIESGAAAGPSAEIVTWENAAAEVQAYIDNDDPHASFLQVLVTDVEGDLGAALWPLGPMQVRELRNQLDEVLQAQELAQWVAEGGAAEDFVSYETGFGDGPEYGADDDAADDEDHRDDAAGRARKVADPMNVQGLLDRAPLVFGIPVRTLLLVAAALFGVIAVLVTWLT